MKTVPDNLERAWRDVLAGRLSAVSPQDIAALEALLDREPELADRLASQVPPLEPRLSDALAAAETARLPSASEWDAAWDRIERAQGEARAQGAERAQGGARAQGLAHRQRALPRVLRLWRPLVAAAACLALAAVWRAGTRTAAPSAPADDWPLRLARDVEINELEVYDGSTPVLLTGGDQGVEMIWMLDERSAG